MSLYWFCDNCGARYSAVGSRLDNKRPFPCNLCGFDDLYPVRRGVDQEPKRNSHAGQTPRPMPNWATCVNCRTQYSTIGISGEPFTCRTCYATVFPRFN